MVLRGQVGYLGYLGMIAVLDTYKRFRTYIRLLTAIMLIAVAIQLVEAMFGYRMSLGDLGLGANEYYASTRFIEVGNVQTPYLWSRATGPTILLMFLALGCVFEGQQVRRYLPLAALAVLSYLIALSRTWYIAMVVGAVTLVILQRRPRQALAGSILVIVFLIGLGAILGQVAPDTYRGSPWDIWLGRGLTLGQFSLMSSFVGRVELNAAAWVLLWESPLLGHGPGFVVANYASGDLGIMNTLLFYGLVGAIIILGLYLYVWWRGYQLWKRLPSSEEKGYILGLLALMIAYLSTSFSHDALASGGFAVTAAVFIDRVATFHHDGFIGAQEIGG
jgi:O-antigen ligase